LDDFLKLIVQFFEVFLWPAAELSTDDGPYVQRIGLELAAWAVPGQSV